ncbi:gamma-butyrobetaine hydroxylase-like domain-containing protein [Silvibacterium dinghuense]|uniref:DUF971 domain-containing protein n=1 Tax=Silvibacterium dinghuense TaxID=1560006 RepID=A0A4Q1S9B9_9BACT|nr:DUF971 domain-containing protein [Silvibacterium dinghuense]RXS93276.1 DUF971 domain-containing protein [Silvibacterium dinghuense]
MSHEGIRMVSAEEARRAEEADRPLPKEATDPAKVRVHKTEGTGVEIDWKDGHRSAWTFAWLRLACPCATCVEEREREGRKPGEPKAKPVELLPMYQAPPRPETVTPVGRYAISFHWNDGHSSGIYSWDFLRRNCICEACKNSF